MARVVITEKQAKDILHGYFKFNNESLRVDTNTTQAQIAKFGKDSLVIKVDQGVKKRGKLGLLAINKSAKQVHEFVAEMYKKGYQNFILEKILKFEQEDEKYFAIERVREGLKITWCERGGIDIEDHFDEAEEYLLAYSDFGDVKKSPSIKKLLDKRTYLEDLVVSAITMFNNHHLGLLEINPLVVNDRGIFVLDLAVEIDDTALGLDANRNIDFLFPPDKNVTEAERLIRIMDSKTPSALKFKSINPNGRIWVLLSGGGASLVLADEIADMGHGHELANYGEFSGNPTREDTYLYTQIVLKSMLAAKAKNKVLIIAGGVANFTDVAKTYAGVIDALAEFAEQIRKQKIKAYVRRGGPNQEKGLALIADFLQKQDMYGSVDGPDESLTTVIIKALS